MSRVSIERRIQRVRDAVLPPNSLAWRIDRLPDHLKREHQLFRNRCDALISEDKKQGGNRYEMLLNGNDSTPRMPIAVHRALWPYFDRRRDITRDMTVDEAARVYESMLEEGESNDERRHY